jgi:hypothetical protein
MICPLRAKSATPAGGWIRHQIPTFGSVHPITPWPERITSTELNLLRSDSPAQPALPGDPVHAVCVFSARVNQTISATDDITELIYTGASGTLSKRAAWDDAVGRPRAPGAFDKGQAQHSQAPDGSKIYIGRQSEINFANGDI